MKHFPKYFAVFLGLLTGCGPEEPARVDIGLEYFPLKGGIFHVYDVEETTYSGAVEPETTVYQVRVEVTDSFPNADNTFTYVLFRSKRLSPADAWEAIDTWSARIENDQVVVSEGNISYVRLAFPLRKGSSWDGNMFNDLGEDEYHVTAFDEPVTAGGTTFERTLIVNQEMNDDLIVFLDERQEVYARNVGLVAREFRQLHFCTDDHCRGQQQIESGKVFKQELIEYGNW